jgi:hypothetical protein
MVSTYADRRFIRFGAIGVLALAFTVSAASSAISATRSRDYVSVHSVSAFARAAVVTWLTPEGGKAIAYRDATDAAVVRGQTLTYWSMGQRREVIRFHEGGLWQTVKTRYGVTPQMQRAALTSTSVSKMPSPLVRRLSSSAGPQVPAVLTKVDDYGTDVARLAHAVPFVVRFAGPNVLGKQLGRAFISTVSNPFSAGPYRPTESGPIVTFVYSSNVKRLGADDHQITLTFTADSSTAGKANATFLDGRLASIAVNGLVAYKANENQIVFRMGHVIGVAASSSQPTDEEWKTLLSSLRGTG